MSAPPLPQSMQRRFDELRLKVDRLSAHIRTAHSERSGYVDEMQAIIDRWDEYNRIKNGLKRCDTCGHVEGPV